MCPRINFNSIKVRLKQIVVVFCASLALFQFHKGTIKTWVKRHSLMVNVVFQFHKGTIKTYHSL